MKNISRKELARGVAARIYNNPDQKNKIIKMLAGFMLDTRLTNQTELLINDIALEWQKISSETEALVKSRFPLSDSVKGEIEGLVKVHTGSKNIRLHQELDESLIGGVMIKTPELEIDLSMLRALNQLKTI